MSMPSGVQYGRVTGRLIRAVLDGSDGDESPDGAPIPGATVTFRARVRHAKKASAEPPVTIFLDPVVAATDENGVLVTRSGQPGVWLVATDDPGMDPVIGSYTVTVAAPTITSLTWGIVVPSGGTVDLATAVPVPSAPAAALAEWAAVRGEVLAARDVAVATADGIPGLVADAVDTVAGPLIQSSVEAQVPPLVAAEVGSAVLPHAQSAQASATNAATSATSAAGSATAAATSATAAATSATAADGSATSATNAATNAVAAADGIPGLVADYIAANPPPAGDDGREVELQTSATHVQWRYDGDATWLDLIPLSIITGQDGSDGLSAELRTTATHIQWRQAGGAWADLIPLVSLVGPAGPPNTLTIGTVTTLPAGSPATLSLTGEAPEQVLSAGIPMGLTGAASNWLKVGPGDPRTPSTTAGQITGTEPDGCSYRSTDGGGVGGYLWTKRAGVWVCVEGDTGWRKLAPTWPDGYTDPTDASRFLVIRRAGSIVEVATKFRLPDAHLTAYTEEFFPNATIPTGFRPRLETGAIRFDWLTAKYMFGVTPAGGVEFASAVVFDNKSVRGSGKYTTTQAWPTALPGVAV